MTLVKRLEKGEPLTHEEGDENLEYLEKLGIGQELLQQGHELGLTYSSYIIPADVNLKAGVFETDFDIADIFSTILFSNPNDVNLWNNGPIILNVTGVFKGDMMFGNVPNSNDNVKMISGLSFPVQSDIGLFGTTDILNSNNLASENEYFSVVKSSFFEIRYNYNDLGSGEYEHLIYFNFGAFLVAIIVIEGNSNNLHTVDLKFL